jgi:hypothetical protein
MAVRATNYKLAIVQSIAGFVVELCMSLCLKLVGAPELAVRAAPAN